MKKRKRILSLLMAVTILSTSSMQVYASAADNLSESGTEMTEEPTADVENNAEKPTADVENNAEEPTADVENNAEQLAETENDTDETTPADTNDTTVDDAATEPSEEQSKNVEGTVNQETDLDEKDKSGESGESNFIVEGEVIVDVNNDEVEIKENDKPYLSLGADLSEEQRAIVLSIMGIDPANLADYDVVYVTNEEEHQYLGSYIDAAQIGKKSWSSVVIVEREKGNGLNISTNNISYCTVGMYKNALTTAGVTDADIIVAGPQRISGTAALVGILKAYQEMTGEKIEDNVVDAALNELVITGELAESIEGLDNEEVEEFIAYIKAVIAENNLSDEESINEAIDEACEKYGVTLSAEERQMIIDLLLKITALGIDLSGLVDYAASLYDSFKNGGTINSDGFLSAIGNFFAEVFSSIGDFFKNLFS